MSRIVLIVVVWALLLWSIALVAGLARCTCSGAGPDASAVSPRLPSSTSKPARGLDIPVTRSVAARPDASPAQEPAPKPAAKRAAETSSEERDDHPGHGGLGPLPPGVAPELEGLGVQVVLHADGKPVSGARVRSAVQSELEALERQGFSLETGDPAEILAKAKTEMTTSSSGFVILPSAGGKMLVDARSGDLYGFVLVDRYSKSYVRLELSTDQALVVQTVDRAGAPAANVPVLLRDSSCTDVWRATTSGDDALATLKHARFVLDREATPGDAWVIVDAVAPGTAATIVSRTQWPSEPVKLVLEPGGRVVVRVLDLDGKPLASAVDVVLASRQPVAPCARRSSARTGAARATFERVGLGQELVATALGGDEFEDARVNFAGPKKAGDEVAVDVRFVERRPFVQGRIVDAGGKAIAACAIEAWIALPQSAPNASRSRFERLAPSATDAATGADGRFRIPVHTNERAASITSLTLVLRPERSPPAYVVVPIAHGLVPGANDLGESRAAELPVVASGYVIDERNAPVGDARIELLVDGGTTAPDSLPGPADPRFETRADTRGKFQVRGLASGPNVALSARAPDHQLCENMRVATGDTHVSIVLRRNGVIAGRILFPPRMPPTWVRMVIEREGLETPVIIESGGAFRITDQPAGTVSLSVFVEGRDEPVYELDDLEVTAGGSAHDSRLDAIDLRGRLWFAVIAVFDPKGALVKRGNLTVVETNVDGDETKRTFTLQDGFARFVTMTPKYDALVTVEGFVPSTLKDVSGDHEVRLEPEQR